MATSSPTVPDLPKFDNTLGAILIGGLACAVLYGVTCIQAFVYFQSNSHPGERIRWLVGCLWVMDSFDFVLTSHILYYYLVDNFLNPLAMGNIVWSLLGHAAVTSVSDFAVRMMFTLRVHSLSNGNWLLTGTIVALSILDFVCGLIITIRGAQIGTYADLTSIKNIFWLNFAAGCASDLVVAISLSVFLYSAKTGFKRTDSIVNALLAYTINTGLVTAIDEALGMVFYLVMPNNFIFFSFYLLLSKLYLNAYLASLNARGILRDNFASNDLVSIHLSNVSSGPVQFGSGRAQLPSNTNTTHSRTAGRRSRSAHTPTTEVVDAENGGLGHVYGEELAYGVEFASGDRTSAHSLYSEQKLPALEVAVERSVTRHSDYDIEGGKTPVTTTTFLSAEDT